MIRTLTGRATVAILAGFITGAAHALPLTTNLANPSSGSGTVRSGGAPGVTLPEWRANAFTNEAMAWTLESVVLDIAVRSPGTSPGGFQVAIHADDSALPGPGTLLQVLSGASDPAPGQPVYTGSVALAPGATYWVVASVLNSSFTAQYGWSETTDLSQTGPGSIGDTYFVSNDEGVSWAAPVGTGVGGAHKFAINVIPEPGTALLCLTGLLGLARIGRRGARK